MKKPEGPKARPSLKNCKPEPGPGPIVKVQARAWPAHGKKLKPEPEKSQARHITIYPMMDLQKQKQLIIVYPEAFNAV